MDGETGDVEVGVVSTRRCPRCDVCGRAVRVRGVGTVGVWCVGCMSGALPFVGIVGEGDYVGALREFRAGLGSRAGDFMGARFDPFDDEVRGALAGVDGALRGCAYMGGDEVGGRLRDMAKGGGCSLSLLFHNVRSVGAHLEELEAELSRWRVQWDVVGLAETWLDAESEGRMAVEGYSVVAASRKGKGGGVTEGWTHVQGKAGPGDF